MIEPHDKLGLLERVSMRLIGEPQTVSRMEPGASRLAQIEAMRPIERGVVIRGALAGALCGLVSAGGVALAEPLYVEPELANHWREHLPYYGVALGIAVAATIAEVAFLYYDGMKSAVRLGQLGRDTPFGDESEARALKLTLIRAGLELPGRKTPLYDIDPLYARSRLQLLAAALVYKIKVSATNFALKFVLKKLSLRVTGRVSGRAVIELVSVPVFAIWNGIVCHRVMRQARLRALGRGLVDETFELVFPDGVAALDEDTQRAGLAAIREQVSSAGQFHHNVIGLTRRFIDEASEPVRVYASLLGDFESILQPLTKRDQIRIVEFFALLCALDGRGGRRRRKMLVRFQAAVGLAPEPDRIAVYQRAVLEGTPLVDVSEGRFGSG